MAIAAGAMVALATFAMADDGGSADTVLTPAEALQVSGTGTTVKVQGRLENAGTNYFTDRRLILIDEASGSQVNVREWRPASIALPRSGATPMPEVTSDYLGKEVVVTGRVEEQPVKGVGVTKVLIVEGVEVLPKE